MNFENLTVGLHILIIFSIKFQENQRSIAMSLIKSLHFRVFLFFFIFFYFSLKLCIKNKFIDKIVNNI